jgi:L-fuculose-phosphate aldolase
MVTIKGVKYMSDFEAKNAIIDIGRRMYARGFVAANDGNISCKVGPNAIWATPTGVSKGFMKPEMLVKLDLTGKVLQGSSKPSSEIKMHLRVYEENPQVMAVTHAHPPIATAYAVAGIGLEKPILTEGVTTLGVVPVAKYATPGTQEVPDSIAPFVNSYNAVLLANHGALTWGKDAYEAFYRLESVEYYASLLMYTGNIIGKQNPLSCDQVQTLLDNRKNFGITTGGIPPCVQEATNVKDVLTNEPEDMRTCDVSGLKGVTPIVRPGKGTTGAGEGSSCGSRAAGSVCTCSSGTCACGGGAGNATPDGGSAADADTAINKTKEEIIAEVVRRVTQKMHQN